MEKRDQLKTEDQQCEFVISRVFNAPRTLVWKAFTEARHMAQWWGPKAFKARVVTLDLKPGGMFHYRLDGPGGVTMWGRFIYREILEPHKVVYVSSFSDEEGNITRAPFAIDFPLEILNEVTLEEADGKTMWSLRSTPVNATASQSKAFGELFSSMTQGFSGTFDQLDDYLKSLNR